MGSTITSLLSDFEQAIENQDYRTAEETLHDLVDRYDALEAAEEGRIARAFEARDVTDQEANAIKTYTTRAMSADLMRMGFLLQSASYVFDPETVDQTLPLDSARKLREEEASLEDARRTVSDTLETVTIPAVVQLLTTDLPGEIHPKGTSDTLTIVVENVGDAPAEDVTINVTQPSGLGVSPTSTDLSLAAGERATVEVVVSYDTDGEYGLEIELNAGDAGSDVEMFSIVVSTKQDLIATALAGIADLRTRIEETESLGLIQRVVLDAELAIAEEKVELAQEFGEGKKPLLANTTIAAAITKMGLFLNELDLLLLSPEINRALEQTGKGLIDQLVAAKHAKL